MPIHGTPERSGLLKKYYDDPKCNAAFDRCIDVMVRLMQKYGPQLLEQIEENQTNRPDDADHAA